MSNQSKLESAENRHENFQVYLHELRMKYMDTLAASEDLKKRILLEEATSEEKMHRSSLEFYASLRTLKSLDES